MIILLKNCQTAFYIASQYNKFFMKYTELFTGDTFLINSMEKSQQKNVQSMLLTGNKSICVSAQAYPAIFSCPLKLKHGFHAENKVNLWSSHLASTLAPPTSNQTHYYS